MFRLTFLGTSAAQPTLGRNLPALAVRRGAARVLFDCGEGTQRQMMRYGPGFSIDAIFFTHFHADHYLGLLGFVRTLAMQDRREPLDLYGPPPARKFLDAALHLGFDQHGFPIEIHELSGGEIVARGGWRVEVVAVDHGIAALGFAIVEDDRPGEFRLDRAQALGIPAGPLYGKLQRGETIELGREIVQPEAVLGPARRGRKIVVSGDTRPCAALSRAARGADVLVHEATFADGERERAIETRHSTAREAAELAREAGVARLVLTHFSSRYEDDVSLLAREAREAFPKAELAHDGLEIEVPLPRD